ncbi:hypothetical protein GCM10010082_07550 [Kushneria pakistanensis]|uniref:Lipoprotein n=1 Tax=Kushneria pakistanensis TaxID=1508770 RepID=A0ABQ3FCQ0_9GAMM|nr:hypothetical protein [Kushneria pakistanensis]GHC18624.1 hypothetical protein GCM10010082_07550 [Kushneria pakistanensis]
MRAWPALTLTAACLGALLLSGCSNTRQDRPAQDTLVAQASAIDEATARASAMAAGQQQCQAANGGHASLIDMQVTPPAMATMDDDANASSTTGALEAATSEGDAWHATLTLRCR